MRSGISFRSLLRNIYLSTTGRCPSRPTNGEGHASVWSSSPAKARALSLHRCRQYVPNSRPLVLVAQHQDEVRAEKAVVVQLREEAARAKERAGAGGQRERELEQLRAEVKYRREGALGGVIRNFSWRAVGSGLRFLSAFLLLHLLKRARWFLCAQVPQLTSVGAHPRREMKGCATRINRRKDVKGKCVVQTCLKSNFAALPQLRKQGIDRVV